MIDRASITNWSVAHPWGQKSFVEQDLVISRALVSIYSDPLLSEALAFRGGTALHKLYLAPQVRYSEDIDLVQVEPGPIKPIVEKLDAVLAWLPGKTFDLRRFGFRMRTRIREKAFHSRERMVQRLVRNKDIRAGGVVGDKTPRTLPAEEGARPL